MECSERTNVDVALIRCYLLDTRPLSVPASQTPVRKKSGLSETTLFTQHLDLSIRTIAMSWWLLADILLFVFVFSLQPASY